ncbi:putative late blight resistance proteinR1A-10 [Sesamum angolense]|uniref:Late blight resistance proteinR1A-10 n=1 Tax=Sesamum angolense TaxID=2727404 RepID=A0AAE1WUZ9_9LAMI|nr:putative late blight resistance proteinR1A-10 [Sesamum angolense]
MTDAVVEFLLSNLKELLLYHSDLIYGLKDQVESLHKDLSLMKAFLKDSREKRNEFEYVREVVRQITDVAYEAEDIIDTFVVNAAMQKSRGRMSRMIHAFDNASLLRNVGRQIESIRAKVKEIYDKKMFGIVSMSGGEPSRRSAREKRPPVVEEANVVGFDEEAKTIIGRLTEGPEHLEVVSVIGMGGLGKTTLARKVYMDPSIEYHFYLRAWVYVSQEYSRREVFRGILESLGLMNDQMLNMSDDWLAEELCRHLRNNRYLIVIDDVWTREAWDDIRMAFPNTDLASRILLTSRNREVALHANADSPPHNLRFLTVDESWELLCRKTFRKERCPPELEELGRQIARKCYGLPLAIVVISGLLLKREKTHDWWKKVADSVSTHVAKDPKQCMDVLALSYKHLPEHLKVCFIYFGIFPEDYEIPVWKLLRLWVAEGFVQESGQECLEDLAEEYLEDLVDRNLILVATKRANGRIKTCRIHDMLRDLCIKESAEQKFLQVIKGVAPNRPSSTSTQSYHRRLCIHSNVLEFISSKPVGPHVRSFLCFVLDEKNVPRQHTSFIHDAFGLVRVLDLRSISFSRFPNEIVQLVHLRFVALFGNFKILPATISKLWNLQTIIVRTTCRELNILADIWKMLQLRHLHASGISFLNGPPSQTRKNYEDPFVRRNILTISTISPDSCTENIIARTPNLRKLGIRGKLITLVEEKGGSTMFDIVAKLDHLESLKLLNDAFPLDPSRCIIPGLPPSYKFPPNLKKITLSDTLLDWDHMSTLGMLPNLEVLKLKDYAFKGSRWEPLDGGFRLLRVLKIGRTDLIWWEASGHHFPRLQHVVFRHCSSLEAIPSGLAEVSALQNMELHWPKPTAAHSARLIQRQKLKMQQELGQLNTAFKLFIYPPDV